MKYLAMAAVGLGLVLQGSPANASISSIQASAKSCTKLDAIVGPSTSKIALKTLLLDLRVSAFLDGAISEGELDAVANEIVVEARKGKRVAKDKQNKALFDALARAAKKADVKTIAEISANINENIFSGKC